MDSNEIAKRRAMRRKAARRKHLKVGFILFLIFALLIGATLSVTVLFPIKKVVASGSKIYSNEEIISISKLKGKNLFTVSEKTLLTKLQSKMPYVDTVKVKRTFPDTVTLKVTDATEYEAYKINDKFYTVSKNGIVLAEYNEKPQHTFEVRLNSVKCKIGNSVTVKDEKELEILNAIKTELSAKKINVDYIDITKLTNLTVGVEGRFEVLLGSNTDIDRKIAHLNGMINSIDKTQSGTINLSMWTTSKSEGTFIKDTQSN